MGKDGEKSEHWGTDSSMTKKIILIGRYDIISFTTSVFTHLFQYRHLAINSGWCVHRRVLVMAKVIANDFMSISTTISDIICRINTYLLYKRKIIEIIRQCLFRSHRKTWTPRRMEEGKEKSREVSAFY